MNLILKVITAADIAVYLLAGEIYFVTCKSFNIREQNGHILVPVDVDLPELARHELALRSLLLEGDVFDQLLGHKRGQN